MAEQTQQKSGGKAAGKAKLVDKWKLKSWYAVLAPEMFDMKQIGEIVAVEDSQLIDRIITSGLSEITGSFMQASAYTSLYFRVTEVKGKNAHTKLIGHALAPGYIRTLVRRRRSVVNEVVDATTRDGQEVRLKMMALTANKTSESVRKALRHAIIEETRNVAKEMEFSQLMQEVVFGKFGSKIFVKVKKIAPVRRIEIRKSEVKEVFDAEKKQ